MIKWLYSFIFVGAFVISSRAHAQQSICGPNNAALVPIFATIETQLIPQIRSVRNKNVTHKVPLARLSNSICRLLGGVEGRIKSLMDQIDNGDVKEANEVRVELEVIHHKIRVANESVCDLIEDIISASEGTAIEVLEYLQYANQNLRTLHRSSCRQ